MALQGVASGSAADASSASLALTASDLHGAAVADGVEGLSGAALETGVAGSGGMDRNKRAAVLGSRGGAAAAHTTSIDETGTTSGGGAGRGSGAEQGSMTRASNPSDAKLTAAAAGAAQKHSALDA